MEQKRIPSDNKISIHCKTLVSLLRQARTSLRQGGIFLTRTYLTLPTQVHTLTYLAETRTYLNNFFFFFSSFLSFLPFFLNKNTLVKQKLHYLTTTSIFTVFGVVFASAQMTDAYYWAPAFELSFWKLGISGNQCGHILFKYLIYHFYIHAIFFSLSLSYLGIHSLPTVVYTIIYNASSSSSSCG